MIDKKKLKLEYVQKQLENPNISEYEKKQLQRRLDIKTHYSEDNFMHKDGIELMMFTSEYLNDQLATIEKKSRIDSAIHALSANQTAIYYLCMYNGIIEEDSLEQLYDIGCFDEIKGLVNAFEYIGRLDEAKLVKSILGKKLTQKKITQLLSHFREDEKIEQEITNDIEVLIKKNISELLQLQSICSISSG